MLSPSPLPLVAVRESKVLFPQAAALFAPNKLNSQIAHCAFLNSTLLTLDYLFQILPCSVVATHYFVSLLL